MWNSSCSNVSGLIQVLIFGDMGSSSFLVNPQNYQTSTAAQQSLTRFSTRFLKRIEKGV
jgi:hypothetical protein